MYNIPYKKYEHRPKIMRLFHYFIYYFIYSVYGYG